MTRPESEVIEMSNGSAGTQGWYSCEPLSKRRMGMPGPDPDNPLEDSPYYVALKLRTAGKHERYRSLWEWDGEWSSWMLLVLDRRRNIVGQVIGRTQEACSRRMNALFAAKHLGVYDGRYADAAPASTKAA
jgi:hypothetical protein